MITLKNFLQAVDYSITGGSDYGWACYGANARYLDCDESNQYSINCIFDSVDQTVYSVEAWDYLNDREYRWVHPDYIEQLKAESVQRECKFDISTDDRKFIDLEVAEDMLTKMSAIRHGEPYDTRISVPIDMPDEDLLKFMILAHERDMKFNDLVELALREAIKAHKVDNVSN
jgi:hypothetical protein